MAGIFTCDVCGFEIGCDVKHVGRPTKCPKCQTPGQVQSIDQLEATAARGTGNRPILVVTTEPVGPHLELGTVFVTCSSVPWAQVSVVDLVDRHSATVFERMECGLVSDAAVTEFSAARSWIRKRSSDLAQGTGALDLAIECAKVELEHRAREIGGDAVCGTRFDIDYAPSGYSITLYGTAITFDLDIA